MSSAVISHGAANRLERVGERPSWRRAIIMPREHGAWGMLAMPLLCGAAVAHIFGGTAWLNLAIACAATVSAFFLRTPIESLLGVAVVRPANPLERAVAWCAAGFWAALLSGAFLALALRAGIGPLLWPALAALLAFALQAASRRSTRRHGLLSELTGAIALSSGAFISYCAMLGRADRNAVSLWIVNAILACDQVLYVQTRVVALRRKGEWERKVAHARQNYGRACVVSLLVLLIGSAYSLLPSTAFVAYAPLLARSWWSERHNSATPNLRSLGWAEVGLSVASVLLLAFAFALHRR